MWNLAFILIVLLLSEHQYDAHSILSQTDNKSWIFIGWRPTERCSKICQCLWCLDRDRARCNSRFAHQRSCAQCHAQISGINIHPQLHNSGRLKKKKQISDMHQLFAKPIPIPPCALAYIPHKIMDASYPFHHDWCYSVYPVDFVTCFRLL